MQPSPDFPDAVLHSLTGRIDCNLRILRRLIRIGDSGETADLAGQCRPVQSFHIAFRQYFDRAMNVDLDEVRDPQTILAYEMNWQPLPPQHGAPCRLRIEHKYGYKMVKYLYRIELLETLSAAGEGHGGYREDVQYYDNVAAI